MSPPPCRGPDPRLPPGPTPAIIQDRRRRLTLPPAAGIVARRWLRPPRKWGRSSVGRAARSQRAGRGFESLRLHHLFPSPADSSAQAARGGSGPAGESFPGVYVIADIYTGACRPETASSRRRDPRGIGLPRFPPGPTPAPRTDRGPCPPLAARAACLTKGPCRSRRGAEGGCQGCRGSAVRAALAGEAAPAPGGEPIPRPGKPLFQPPQARDGKRARHAIILAWSPWSASPTRRSR